MARCLPDEVVADGLATAHDGHVVPSDNDEEFLLTRIISCLMRLITRLHEPRRTTTATLWGSGGSRRRPLPRWLGSPGIMVARPPVPWLGTETEDGDKGALRGRLIYAQGGGGVRWANPRISLVIAHGERILLPERTAHGPGKRSLTLGSLRPAT
jgi:hypothetical protein